MTEILLFQNGKTRTSGPASRLIQYPARVRTYREHILDLQFAIDAGDKQFAPAMKLLFREALQLARNHSRMPARSYQAGLAAVKAAYLELLEIDTNHSVVKRLQEHYKQSYDDRLWDFLEIERMLFEETASPSVISSLGNLNKHYYFLVKRVMDFTLSLALLIILAPLLACIALAIKLESPGSPIFVQERVGVKRRTRASQSIWEISNFRVYKFRTMHQNADQSLHQKYVAEWTSGTAAESDDKTARFKLDKDPRITRVGAILRKTSLDELPQLFNVLKGEMSLVGPRPVPTYEVAQYQQHHHERLAALPGITGLWQVRGRGRVTFEEQVRLDVEYIHRQSLWNDIKILFLTIPAVLLGTGAK
jgi:lipopolysaccharide/colanic/teichoic acid biosynthesis glycosyltransferase